jgi:hypothetical protein
MNLIHAVLCFVLFLPPGLWQGKPPTPSYLKQAELSQTDNTIHVSANSPRPLEQALDALRVKYSWAVGYEDPQYLSKSDLVETAPQNGAAHDWLPGGGAFTVDFRAGNTNDPPSLDKVLPLIVDAYNHSTNPGQFELRSNPDGTSAVVGVAARDEKGRITPQKPVLDSPLTLQTQERTATDTVNLICQQIAERAHVQVTVGVSPWAVMDHTKVNVGGAQESARALLSRTLTSTGRKLYWRMLFDPNSKGYLLDIHLIRNAPPHETPKPATAPVSK